MTIRTTPQIICDILKTCMKLSADQIWIYNQRREIPSDKKLYVVVGMMSAIPYGNNKNFSTSGQDNLSQYIKEIITIDLLSYSTEVQEKYSMVLGSLVSTYSQQIQESLALKIFPIPSSVSDVSSIEGAALLNRIAITLPVLRKYDMLLEANYYDDIPDFTLTNE